MVSLVLIEIVVMVAIMTHFFHYVLLGNKKIMATSDTERMDVRDIKSHYIIEDNIFSFRHQVNLSSLGDKEEPILKTCSTTERANMVILDDCLTSYFYLHLPVVCDIWVFIPLSLFQTELLKMLNVAPSHITHNGWSLIRVFGIICRWLGPYHMDVIFLLW